jgi:hypothetical protein
VTLELDLRRGVRFHDGAEFVADDVVDTLEYVSGDSESSYLELDPDSAGPMEHLLGHSITDRVAVGPRAGQKVFSLQPLPVRAEELRKGVAQYVAFSLHAGIGVEGGQREPHVLSFGSAMARTRDTRVRGERR